MAKQLGYPCKDVIPLTQDASARKYFRLNLKPSKKSLAEGFLESETAIFCYLNPNLGSHKNFIHVCNHIDIGPKILEYDLELGVTIQTDVGKYNYAQAHDAWMNRYYELSAAGEFHEEEGSIEFLGELYSEAFEIYPLFRNEGKRLLKDFVNSKIPKLKKISDKKLLSQMQMFQKIFLKKFLGFKSKNKEIIGEIEALQKETLKELKKQKWVNCHTDFEYRNIMVSGIDELGLDCSLIDFQDTCIGPEGIDLAGISVVHSEDFKFHHRLSVENRKKITWGGIQRNMRILGTLVNLYLQQNRSFRLIDLPNILSNLIYLIPNKYSNLKTFLTTNIQKDLDAKVSSIIGNPLTTNQAMVLAAGYGKRMMPLTKKTPKPLLKVGDETLLDIHLNKLLDAGFDDIFVNVSYLGDKIKKHVKKNYINDITIIEEKTPLGTGGALVNASKHFRNNDWILVINADIYCNIDFMRLRSELKKAILYYSNRKIKAFLVAVNNPSHNEKGDFYVDIIPRTHYSRYVDHHLGLLRATLPTLNEMDAFREDDTFTWSGISFIHGSVFDDFKVNIKSPFDSWSKIIKPLIQQRKVAAFCDGCKWIDVGTPNRLKLANEMLKEEN